MAKAIKQCGEGDIRRALIEADLVDCMPALPGQLFYSTQIPVCLGFLAKNKHDGSVVGKRTGTRSMNLALRCIEADGIFS